MHNIPSQIKLRKADKLLELGYRSGETYQLSAEFLRVHSPSAEVQGHGNPVLQYGKRGVELLQVEPVGRYALKLIFSDGHDSGIFSWEYLEHLATQQDGLWEAYLTALQQAGKSRDPDTTVIRLE